MICITSIVKHSKIANVSSVLKVFLLLYMWKVEVIDIPTCFKH